MASREGPSEVSLKPTDPPGDSLQISAGNLEVHNANNNYAQSVRADVLVRGGKWYWEVKLGNAGHIQLGVCTAAMRPPAKQSPLQSSGWGSSSSSASATAGIGNDREGQSWSFNGGKQQKYHGSSNGEAYGEGWSSGDVIGVLLDCDARSLTFFRNGSDMGTAFTNVNIGDGVYPAATFDRKTKATFNFGKTPFKYNMPEVFPDVRPLHVKLTNSQGRSLLELFQKYKDIGLSMSESGEISGEDHIKGAGSMQLAEDLGAESDEDPILMLVAWKLNAKSKVWEFSRDEWVQGWSVSGCGSIDEMRAQCAKWKREIASDERAFKSFYFFVFDYLKEDRRILPAGEAMIAWNMLGMKNRWPQLWPAWEKFVEGQDAVQRDAWRLFFSFTQQHKDQASLASYDEDGCWPTIIDDFVNAMKEGKLATKEEAAKGTKGDDSSSSSDSD